ncbi:hypothetical protein AMK34_11495 [Amycolatopsis sp. CB00013]|nr:hypothetical protein AMK34_11495 [Amycolatopsis sp. CB00013]
MNHTVDEPLYLVRLRFRSLGEFMKPGRIRQLNITRRVIRFLFQKTQKEKLREVRESVIFVLF